MSSEHVETPTDLGGSDSEEPRCDSSPGASPDTNQTRGSSSGGWVRVDVARIKNAPSAQRKRHATFTDRNSARSLHQILASNSASAGDGDAPTPGSSKTKTSSPSALTSALSSSSSASTTSASSSTSTSACVSGSSKVSFVSPPSSSPAASSVVGDALDSSAGEDVHQHQHHEADEGDGDNDDQAHSPADGERGNTDISTHSISAPVATASNRRPQLQSQKSLKMHALRALSPRDVSIARPSTPRTEHTSSSSSSTSPPSSSSTCSSPSSPPSSQGFSPSSSPSAQQHTHNSSSNSSSSNYNNYNNNIFLSSSSSSSSSSLSKSSSKKKDKSSSKKDKKDKKEAKLRKRQSAGALVAAAVFSGARAAGSNSSSASAAESAQSRKPGALTASPTVGTSNRINPHHHHHHHHQQQHHSVMDLAEPTAEDFSSSVSAAANWTYQQYSEPDQHQHQRQHQEEQESSAHTAAGSAVGFTELLSEEERELLNSMVASQSSSPVAESHPTQRPPSNSFLSSGTSSSASSFSSVNTLVSTATNSTIAGGSTSSSSSTSVGSASCSSPSSSSSSSSSTAIGSNATAAAAAAAASAMRKPRNKNAKRLEGIIIGKTLPKEKVFRRVGGERQLVAISLDALARVLVLRTEENFSRRAHEVMTRTFTLFSSADEILFALLAVARSSEEKRVLKEAKRSKKEREKDPNPESPYYNAFSSIALKFIHENRHSIVHDPTFAQQVWQVLKKMSELDSDLHVWATQLSGVLLREQESVERMQRNKTPIRHQILTLIDKNQRKSFEINRPLKPLSHMETLPSPEQLLSWEPAKIAAQITFVQLHLIQGISRNELLSKAYTRAETSPWLHHLIQCDNRLIMYFSLAILASDDVAVRGRVIIHVIRICDELRRHNNFDGCFTVFAALESTAVKRLKHSWSSLSASDERMYETVSRLCSLGENYKEYRTLLRQVDEKYPYVVYFGGLLRDLTFTDEASNFVEDHKINWKKMTLIADVLISVERTQSAHFGPTTLDEAICQTLFLHRGWNEELQYQRSKELEATVEPEINRIAELETHLQMYKDRIELLEKRLVQAAQIDFGYRRSQAVEVAKKSGADIVRVEEWKESERPLAWMEMAALREQVESLSERNRELESHMADVAVHLGKLSTHLRGIKEHQPEMSPDATAISEIHMDGANYALYNAQQAVKESL